ATAQHGEHARRETSRSRAIALHYQTDGPYTPHHRPLPRKAPTTRLHGVPGRKGRDTAIFMARQSELFTSPSRTTDRRPAASAPLAERMRAKTIEEFVGQRHLLGPWRLLSDLLASGRVESLILWGPPGSGKTTLAHLLSEKAGGPRATFSAV